MKTIIRNIFSRPIFQPFFEIILNLSLKIINVGEGHTVETSGEKITFELLDRTAEDKEAIIVFDVGAHTGEWFKLFKDNYKKDAKVYSFEPSDESYNELSKIKMDGFHPINIALGNINDKKYLSFNKRGDTTSYVSEKGSPNSSQEIKVATLDKYCQDNNINNIDLLKLDVEGYELKILSGAKRMIENGNIELIQFEFGAPSIEKYCLKDFFDILDNRYQICRILKHGIYPIKKYQHYYEIMTLTNFIAIKRKISNKNNK